MPGWKLALLFWTGEIITLSTVLVPLAWFLVVGWRARRDEFVNRIKGRSEHCYLNHFWSRNDRCRERMNFSDRYTFMAGRRLFALPATLLAIVVSVFGGLVLQSAIAAGVGGNCGAASWPASASDLRAALGSGFAPFPPVTLPPPSVSALVGAYLFAANALIQGYRARSLVSSDVLWCALRIIIAIPLGFGLSSLKGGADWHLANFVGLGLGAFPIAEIFTLVRRLFALSFGEKESADNNDQLIAMLGVTPATAAVLNAEGISSAQQLADQDPVSIALRTGLSFDYVMNLVAQSQAWSFIGGTAKMLAPLGLGDARTIARLVNDLNRTPPDPIQQAACATLAAAAELIKIPAPILETAFRRIRADGYTAFLLELDA